MRKELAISRLVAGCQILRIEGHSNTLVYKTPLAYDRYAAEILFDEAFDEATSESLYSDNELLEFLVDQHFWSASLQEKMDLLEQDIETMKVKMHELYFKTVERELVRKNLHKAKAQYEELYGRRHSYDHLTCAGYANTVKVRYLTGCSIYHENGNRYFDNSSFMNHPDDLIDKTLYEVNKSRISEKLFREIARTEPWRGIWNAKKAGHIFSLPISELSDEQRYLITWSSVYDNIYENSECPPEDIINDDDCLDGWMIVQRRKRADSQTKCLGQDKITGKNKNADEIYLMADTVDDAKKIEGLNDTHAKVIKQQRNNLLKKMGSVSDLEMPDVKSRLQQEATQKIMARMKGQ